MYWSNPLKSPLILPIFFLFLVSEPSYFIPLKNTSLAGGVNIQSTLIFCVLKSSNVVSKAFLVISTILLLLLSLKKYLLNVPLLNSLTEGSVI